MPHFKKLHCILIWNNVQNTKLEFTETLSLFSNLRTLCYTSKYTSSHIILVCIYKLTLEEQIDSIYPK